MAYNIGLNVVEVDGTAAPAIVGAAVSVGAFNILTRRGVPNRPARVNSYARFVELFGGHFVGGLGAYLIKGFFDNGGQTAYVNRIASNDPATGALPATVTLNNSGGAPTLKLEAGYRGSRDPGMWGNDLSVKIIANTALSSRLSETAAATVSSAVLTEPVDMSALLSLAVAVDGETPATVISFQAADFPAGANQATLAQIRDAINRRQTKVLAAVTGDKRISLTSTGSVARQRKSWTSLQVTQANASLGFSSAMANAVLGTAAARTASSTTLANAGSFKVGDAVRLSDGTAQAYTKILTVDAQSGAVTFKPDVSALASWDATKVTFTTASFDLEIYSGGSKDENRVERWTGLSMESDLADGVVGKLNDAMNGSRYVYATAVANPSAPGGNVPAEATSPFTQGREGTVTTNDFIGDPAAHTGFSAFDSYDVQLVCAERSDPAIVTAGLSYCAGRGDCMFVGSVPENSDVTAMTNYGKSFQGKKVFGALYGPWIIVSDPLGMGDNPLKKIPPTGHVMGVYARIESSRGVWKAPAGDEANLLGVIDVESRLSDAEHTGLVKDGSVNGVRAVPRAGVIVDASRTLSTDTRWLYVNVRLLFNYVKSSLRQGLRWVRQEPNRDTLWKSIKFDTVTPFLLGLWRQGAFGTGTPQQVFTVVCDASNNPPDQVDQGNLKIEVYFYPSKPAETIVIIVGQQPSGAKASEN